MKNSQVNLFTAAIVLSGIELLYDFSMLNLFSLQVLLANMDFYYKIKLAERPVFLYSSSQHNNECTTMIFLHQNDIMKVRYLNINLEKFMAG